MITKHNFYEKGKNPKRKEKLWTKVSKSVGAKIKAKKIKLGVQILANQLFRLLFYCSIAKLNERPACNKAAQCPFAIIKVHCF